MPSRLGAVADLAVDFAFDFLGAFQLVPQAVDLVQHHQAALLVPLLVADVIAPDLDVGLGDAGVGREDEQHRMGVGQHVEGQFRLGADGIEARRVEDDQPLLQQRMREIDDGVAPAGDLHRAVFVHGDDAVFVFFVIQPIACGFLQADLLGLAHLQEGVDHGFG